MDSEVDFDVPSIVLPRHEHWLRPVPFPVVSQGIFLSKYNKRDLNRAMGSMLPVKLPMRALHASQETVSPLGVERFVLLALAGLEVPMPVVVHFDGILVIQNGHHRATALFDLGADLLHAQLADLGGNSIWR